MFGTIYILSKIFLTKILAYDLYDIPTHHIANAYVNKWEEIYGDDTETLKHQMEMEVLNDKIFLITPSNHMPIDNDRALIIIISLV
jgi:hypothetical protein